MRMNYLLGTAVLLMVASCTGSSSKKEVEEEVVMQDVVQAPVLFGTYQGVLSAADCEGIRITLTINPDSTYTLNSEYIGAEDGYSQTCGVYNMLLDSTLVELITPSSGDKTYYKVVADGIMLSDSLGIINQGELANHYILKKK